MTSYAFVHLEFGNAHRDRSLKVLKALHAQLAGPGDTSMLVVVDNKQGTVADVSEPDFSTSIAIAGDNGNREFTGWDVGVAAVRAQAAEPDVWVFSNDTIALHHGWSQSRTARFAAEMRRLVGHGGPWLFGEIKEFPRSIATPFAPVLEFVQSYFFAMNGALREAMETLSPDQALLDAQVQPAFEPARRLFRGDVDKTFDALTSTWLLNDDPEATRRNSWTHAWHKAEPLSTANFDDLRMKARCCLSELLLTARARRLGADLRSPYDARTTRAHLQRSLQMIADKLWERRYLRQLGRSRV